MKLLELFEGAMKRSDPYISGDRDGSRQKSQNVIKKSPHEQKLEALAKRGNVQVSQVSKIWDEEREKIDKNNQNRWMIVMKNVKNRLGIS